MTLEKINLNQPEDKLKKALESYREQALALGASQAAIVQAAAIPVDDRVTLKYQIALL